MGAHTRISPVFIYINDTFISSTSAALWTVFGFFIITEHWQGVQTLPLDDIVVISAVLDPTQMNIQIINSRHSYIQVDYSHDFFKRGALARFDRSPLLTTMAQGPLSYAFSHTCEDCHSPLRWPTYVVRKNESFSRTLGGKAGQKVWSVNIDESKGPTTGRTVPGLLGA